MNNMKFKIVLVLVFMFVSLLSYSQNNQDTYMYCEIVGKSKFLSSKIHVEIDYGQNKRWLTEHKLVDEKGKTISFNNMIDAMNYMGSKGWKFVHAYEVKDGEEVIQHWLLERPRDEEAIPKTKSND